MASHAISGVTTGSPSCDGSMFGSIGLEVNTAKVRYLVAPRLSGNLGTSGDGGGPARPTSGLVYPLYL